MMCIYLRITSTEKNIIISRTNNYVYSCAYFVCYSFHSLWTIWVHGIKRERKGGERDLNRVSNGQKRTRSSLKSI